MADSRKFSSEELRALSENLREQRNTAEKLLKDRHGEDFNRPLAKQFVRDLFGGATCGIEDAEVREWYNETLALVDHVFGTQNLYVRRFIKLQKEHDVDIFGFNSFSTGRLLKDSFNILEDCIKQLEMKINITSKPKKQDRRVFIVHGHNEQTKDEVEKFLTKYSLEPIILHKQANLGKTIIEKVEHYSNSVRFAIILLTGDDIGAKKNTPHNPPSFQTKKGTLIANDQWKNAILDNLKKRARQNVIFEFGYFVGLLGRENVIILYEDGVELPSDTQGLLYISLNSDWQNQLVNEIKAVGIDC
ncbi:putative nucleotide-binding protein containing TIR-like domain protein [anaerobic digester metagenome]|uniref:Nucleotide-binding protein containing TIR-like domain n=2 Tax=Methanoculleus TaxID=45989 RepID=A3CWB8_METMJ|nr:nucleotide-binding protein containing TIR-like domain [Methanoculleus marisnigri JR1]